MPETRAQPPSRADPIYGTASTDNSRPQSSPNIHSAVLVGARGCRRKGPCGSSRGKLLDAPCRATVANCSNWTRVDALQRADLPLVATVADATAIPNHVPIVAAVVLAPCDLQR